MQLGTPFDHAVDLGDQRLIRRGRESLAGIVISVPPRFVSVEPQDLCKLGSTHRSGTGGADLIAGIPFDPAMIEGFRPAAALLLAARGFAHREDVACT